MTDVMRGCDDAVRGARGARAGRPAHGRDGLAAHDAFIAIRPSRSRACAARARGSRWRRTTPRGRATTLGACRPPKSRPAPRTRPSRGAPSRRSPRSGSATRTRRASWPPSSSRSPAAGARRRRSARRSCCRRGSIATGGSSASRRRWPSSRRPRRGSSSPTRCAASARPCASTAGAPTRASRCGARRSSPPSAARRPCAPTRSTRSPSLGDTPRKLMFSGVESLTASERRVAELAAAGRTNRDIAQELFVTPKTVENHLGRSYVKLGISGRRELAGADLSAGLRAESSRNVQPSPARAARRCCATRGAPGLPRRLRAARRGSGRAPSSGRRRPSRARRGRSCRARRARGR